MKVLTGNCTGHMLAEILENVTSLQERRADLQWHQESATQEATSTLCQQGQWQLAWWQKWPDVPKARTRKDFCFRFLSLPRVSGSSYLQYPRGLPGFCLFAFEFCQYLILPLQSSGCLVGFALLYRLLEKERFDRRLTPCQNTIR